MPAPSSHPLEERSRDGFLRQAWPPICHLKCPVWIGTTWKDMQDVPRISVSSIVERRDPGIPLLPRGKPPRGKKASPRE